MICMHGHTRAHTDADVHTHTQTFTHRHTHPHIHTKGRNDVLEPQANMSTEIKLVYYFQRGKKITKQKAVIFYTSDYY